MSVRASAGGAGEKPRDSSLARMKASIGFWILDLRFWIEGKPGRLIGCQHQCSAFRSARSNSVVANDAVAAASWGQGAPIWTHFVSAAISSVGRRDLGGI